jgi:hypothetical protein
MTEILGLKTGLCSPCVWHSDDVGGRGVLRVVCHGDDIVGEGTGEALLFLKKQLEEHWMISFKGILSHDANLRTCDHLRILGRYVSCDEYGYHLEADARHAELLSRNLSSPVTSPCVREEEPQEGDDELLDNEDSTLFRSLTMRAAYLSLDRPDIAYSVRRLSRHMARPTVAAMKAFKRLGRYLLHAPRLVLDFPWRKVLDKELVCDTDADFAGCKSTRKSSSGFSANLGPYPIKFTSKSQSVVSLSTSESEFYGLIGCVSCGLGLVQLAKDLGLDLKLGCRSDATSTIVMATRRGLGKAKHIATGFMWAQDIFRSKRAGLSKVGTNDNKADLGTKPLSAEKVRHLSQLFGCRFCGGRHPLALEV